MYDDLVKRLREEAIQWCANCVYKSAESHICHAPEEPGCDIRDRLQAADAIQELSKPRWVSVTERLPKMRDAGILKKLGINLRSDKCLIVISDGKDQIVDNDAELRDGKWHSDTLRWLSAGKKTFEVTHWQPLPKPPKEEKI